MNEIQMSLVEQHFVRAYLRMVNPREEADGDSLSMKQVPK